MGGYPDSAKVERFSGRVGTEGMRYISYPHFPVICMRSMGCDEVDHLIIPPWPWARRPSAYDYKAFWFSHLFCSKRDKNGIDYTCHAFVYAPIPLGEGTLAVPYQSPEGKEKEKGRSSCLEKQEALEAMMRSRVTARVPRRDERRTRA